jgi:hypothetical protein
MAPEQTALIIIEVRRAAIKVPRAAVEGLELYFRVEQGLLQVYSTR